jgi:rare lipoprotein A
VTNKDNGKSVVVKVNDRGPFHGNRVLDLSYGAAKQLGVTNAGTAKVSIERVDGPNS